MFYSQKDLDALEKNLQDCHHYVERGRDEHSPHLLTLLDARTSVCEETLAELKLNLSELTPELVPKWEKLVSILRSLAGCNARSKVVFVLRRAGQADLSLSSQTMKSKSTCKS